MLICAEGRATRGSGWLIKTQVLYEHNLAGHRQVIFLLFGSYARNIFNLLVSIQKIILLLVIKYFATCRYSNFIEFGVNHGKNKKTDLQSK